MLRAIHSFGKFVFLRRETFDNLRRDACRYVEVVGKRYKVSNSRVPNISWSTRRGSCWRKKDPIWMVICVACKEWTLGVQAFLFNWIEGASRRFVVQISLLRWTPQPTPGVFRGWTYLRLSQSLVVGQRDWGVRSLPGCEYEESWFLPPTLSCRSSKSFSTCLGWSGIRCCSGSGKVERSWHPVPPPSMYKDGNVPHPPYSEVRAIFANWDGIKIQYKTPIVLDTLPGKWEECLWVTGSTAACSWCILNPREEMEPNKRPKHTIVAMKRILLRYKTNLC